MMFTLPQITPFKISPIHPLKDIELKTKKHIKALITQINKKNR